MSSIVKDNRSVLLKVVVVLVFCPNIYFLSLFITIQYIKPCAIKTNFRKKIISKQKLTVIVFCIHYQSGSLNLSRVVMCCIKCLYTNVCTYTKTQSDHFKYKLKITIVLSLVWFTLERIITLSVHVYVYTCMYNM